MQELPKLTRRILPTSLLILLSFFLSGCALVIVSTSDGRPSLHPYLLGVSVSRGTSDALSVKTIGIGLLKSCYDVGLGVYSSKCVVIDDESCTAIIVDKASEPVKNILRNIARQAESDCLSKEIKETK
jgi:hypothetical protein